MTGWTEKARRADPVGFADYAREEREEFRTHYHLASTGSGFTETGGTNTIARRLYLGQQSGSTGTYDLSGGAPTARSIERGAGSANFNWTGGTLHVETFGRSALPFDLVNGGVGILAPGNSIASTEVFGNYTQGTEATLAIELDIASADQLIVTGNVHLDGTLTLQAISKLNEAPPGKLEWYGDETRTIITAGNINGTFANEPLTVPDEPVLGGPNDNWGQGHLGHAAAVRRG